ncbi:hypothetical protein LRD18_13120, partial [Halorhodospira halochloris]|uniref:hypothetical protein n=1 Tax=Halorhodospira halochloris TaxID=1052 RepID=UPI001EE8CF9F
MGLSNLPPMMSADRMDELESNRELVMAAYVMRGELDAPDEMEDGTWQALVAGEASLDDYMHEGEARADYWLGELDNGLSGDELLGQMLYEASYGNVGRNTDPSNVEFREAMALELKARLDDGQIDETNLPEVAFEVRNEMADAVSADNEMTVEEALEAAETDELPTWFSIGDSAENIL